MVSIDKLRIGYRVKIVDHWPNISRVNEDGLMDHWLGTIMTVRQINKHDVNMQEDEGEWHGPGWYWDAEMLDYIVENEILHTNVEDLI